VWHCEISRDFVRFRGASVGLYSFRKEGIQWLSWWLTIEFTISDRRLWYPFFSIRIDQISELSVGVQNDFLLTRRLHTESERKHQRSTMLNGRDESDVGSWKSVHYSNNEREDSLLTSPYIWCERVKDALLLFLWTSQFWWEVVRHCLFSLFLMRYVQFKRVLIAIVCR
jgi:hypothetical protein